MQKKFNLKNIVLFLFTLIVITTFFKSNIIKTKYIIDGLFFISSFMYLLKSGYQIKFDKFDNMIFFMVILVIISSIVNNIGITILNDVYLSLDYIIPLLLVVVVRLLNLNEKEIKYYIFYPFFITSIIAISYELYKYLVTHEHELFSLIGARNRSTMFVVFVNIISLCSIIFIKDKILKNFIILSFIISLFAILVANSRSSWGSLFIAYSIIIISCYFDKSVNVEKLKIFIANKIFIIAILLICIVALYLNIDGIEKRVEQGFNIQGRMLMWMASYNEIKNNLFFGIGPIQFRNVDLSYYSSLYPDLKFEQIHFKHAHNTFIHISVELGLVFLLTFLYFLGSMLKLSYKFLMKENFLTISFLLTIALFVSYTNHLFYQQEAILLCIFFGLALQKNLLRSIK